MTTPDLTAMQNQKTSTLFPTSIFDLLPEDSKELPIFPTFAENPDCSGLILNIKGMIKKASAIFKKLSRMLQKGFEVLEWVLPIAFAATVILLQLRSVFG